MKQGKMPVDERQVQQHKLKRQQWKKLLMILTLTLPIALFNNSSRVFQKNQTGKLHDMSVPFTF
jgi:hypothetical protein